MVKAQKLSRYSSETGVHRAVGQAKPATSDPWSVARRRMVLEQIVSRGISDKRVLSAMESVPRHLYVHEALARQAYGDYPLQIGSGQTISQPYIVALMTQALHLTGNENVLEIGTGCGYQTTILSLLAKTVCTIERHQELALAARRTFRLLGIKNVTMRIGDGSIGWKEKAPFDRILMACAAPRLPRGLLEQLAVGGFLILPVEDTPDSQSLWRITRHENDYSRENLGPCRFVPLVGKHGFKH